MKRHPTLAHLSRDHHPALILAQLLKRNAPPYKAMPTSTEGKMQYASGFYEKELLKHFGEEEKMMDMLAGIDTGLDEMIKQIRIEHSVLHDLFKDLEKSDDPITALDKLGNMLDTHIRKEERQLFPLIENCCNEKVMSSIEKLLTR